MRVLYTNDRSAKMHLQVQLLTGTGRYQEEAFTSDLGQVEFPPVVPGNYRLKLRGEEIEDTTTDVFTVSEREGTHYEVVRVPLKPGAPEPQKTAAAAISSTELRIPPKAKKEFDRGNDALTRKEWEEARKRFETAIHFYPQYAAAYNNLGVVYMSSGNPQLGRDAFQKAVTLDGGSAGAYLNLGRMAYSEREYAQSEVFLNKSLAVEPTNAEALTLISKHNYSWGNLMRPSPARKRSTRFPTNSTGSCITFVRGRSKARIFPLRQRRNMRPS